MLHGHEIAKGVKCGGYVDLNLNEFNWVKLINESNIFTKNDYSFKILWKEQYVDFFITKTSPLSLASSPSLLYVISIVFLYQSYLYPYEYLMDSFSLSNIFVSNQREDKYNYIRYISNKIDTK